MLRSAGLSLVAFLAVALLVRYMARSRKGARTPPGPPRRFLLGNILDIPTKNIHLVFARMAEKYGPVMSLTLPTSKMVILSTATAASDLLEKRGAIFSDRPEFPMMELMGWGWDFVLERYGDSWKAHRKIAQQFLNGAALKRYASAQTRLVRVFASELLETPSEFIGLVKRNVAANLLEATYGFEMVRKNDEFLKIIEDAMEKAREAMVFGKYAVDLIPALKYVPKWFPGARFKRDAANWSVYSERELKIPFARAKAEMENGTARPSIISSALTDDGSPQWQRTVMEAAGVVFIGGSDTTAYTVISFFLEMVRHPEIQLRAHEELSTVIGRDRLPTLDDRASLPYIEAVIREVLRMHPVVPLGVPHRVTEDTLYNGMLITEGTTVYANIWAILNDASVYTDPHLFNPDRFLREGKIDESVFNPRSAVYGYGRRICAGMHVADVLLFLSVATTLTCFDIGKAVRKGVVVEPRSDFEHGSMSVPPPFECTITPRDLNVKMLIEQALESGTL